MGLLDGDLKNIIGNAADFLFLRATLYREAVTQSSPSEPWKGGTVGAPVSYACKAIREEYSERFRLDGTVKAGDVKIIVLAKSCPTEPLVNDIIQITGDRKRTIISVATDPANAVWELQARG